MLALLAGYDMTFAQDDDIDLDEIELTQEQWEAVRDTFAVYAIKHLARLDTLNMEIDSLRKVNNELAAIDCERDLYAMVGATREEVADFRRKFEETEKKVNGKIGSPDDARKMYFNEVSASRIRCLPEFSDRYMMLAKKLEPWYSTNVVSGDSYEVVKGDCLWLISKMKYDTPYLWPAIWDANRTDIINPNLIYPGQVFKIPQMSEAQKKEAQEKSQKIKRFRKRVKNTSNLDSFRKSDLFERLTNKKFKKKRKS